MPIQQIQYNGQTYDIDAPDGTKPEDYLKYAKQAEIAHLKQTSSQETDEEKKLKGEGTGKEKTQAEWDAEPASQKGLDMLHWGAGALRGATGVRVGDTDTSPLSQAETNAREHPILFGTGVAGELAAPAVMAGVKASGPAGGLVRGVRTAAADALRHPAVEAAATGADFANSPMATIMRRGQGPINRVRNVLASMMDPGPLSVVDRTMPNISAGPRAADVASVASPVPLRSADAETQAVVDRYMPNTSAHEDQLSSLNTKWHPNVTTTGVTRSEGLPTEGRIPYASPSDPVAPNPNAGGRLAGRRMNPSQALEIALSGSPRGFVEGDTANVALPEQVQPPVYLSPKARALAGKPPTSLETLEDAMRQREQSAAAQRYSPDLNVVDESAPTQTAVTPKAAKTMFDQMQENLKAIPAHGDQEVSVKSGDTVMKHKTVAPKPQAPAPTEDLWTKTDADLYKELAGKAFKTPHEWQIYDNLDRIMKMRASAMGRSYAAGAK